MVDGKVDCTTLGKASFHGFVPLSLDQADYSPCFDTLEVHSFVEARTEVDNEDSDRVFDSSLLLTDADIDLSVEEDYSILKEIKAIKGSFQV